MMCARSRADALFHGTAARTCATELTATVRQGERKRDGRGVRAERARVGNSSDALCIYRFTYLVGNYFAIVMTFSV